MNASSESVRNFSALEQGERLLENTLRSAKTATSFPVCSEIVLLELRPIVTVLDSLTKSPHCLRNGQTERGKNKHN
jgi:hypothetical protein